MTDTVGDDIDDQDPGPMVRQDPLDAVSTATKIWRKAAAASSELDDRDRAIVRAFDAGRTGTEIAACSGLSLEVVYRVHKQADQIKRDDEFTRSIDETSRRLAENRQRLADLTAATTAGRALRPEGPRAESSDEPIRRILQRIPADAAVVRGIAPDHADKMMEFYEKHRTAYGL